MQETHTIVIEKQLHTIRIVEVRVRAAFAPPDLVGIVPTQSIWHACVPGGTTHRHRPVNWVARVIDAVVGCRVLAIPVAFTWRVACFRREGGLLEYCDGHAEEKGETLELISRAKVWGAWGLM